MRVAIISPGVPHPERGASVVLFHHYIAALKDAGHSILHTVLGAGRSIDRVALEAHACRVNLTIGDTLLVHEVGPILATRRFKVVRNESAARTVREGVERFCPDAIVCFDLEAAAAAGPLTARRKTVWLGDLNFQSVWYNYVYGFRERPSSLRWLPHALAQRASWRRRYAETLETFDPIIVSSRSSVDQLHQLGLKSHYHPYPWPVEKRTTQPLDANPHKPSLPTFLFFGNLTGLGSRSALHFLFGKVLPHLRRAWGANAFRLIIAGHSALRDWATSGVQETPEIDFVGFVDDLGSLIQRCHAVLAPMDVPVGNRSRIVTAMAYGGLIIAHRNTCLGNPALVDGRTALLFNDVHGMVRHMVAAAKKPDAHAAIIAAARDVYERQFAPRVAGRLFVDILGADEQLPRPSPTGVQEPSACINSLGNSAT